MVKVNKSATSKSNFPVAWISLVASLLAIAILFVYNSSPGSIQQYADQLNGSSGSFEDYTVAANLVYGSLFVLAIIAGLSAFLILRKHMFKSLNRIVVTILGILLGGILGAVLIWNLSATQFSM